MKDKIVCITGASSGIGWATAKAFANHNARLIICGRRKEKLVELQKYYSTLIKKYLPEILYW